MTPEQLRTLREHRGMTRDQLAEFLGDCSGSTVNKWERGMHAIPAWVEHKMLSTTELHFTAPQLSEMMNWAREENISFSDLLSLAISTALEDRKAKKNTDAQAQSNQKPVQPKSKIVHLNEHIEKPNRAAENPPSYGKK